jgi:glycosyltransferase involved in cell wall biosynthesis
MTPSHDVDRQVGRYPEPHRALLPHLILSAKYHRLSVSVLCPVFNERHLVAASLGRVLSFTSNLVSRLELIAVDDCSTDGTWEVLQQLAAADSRIRLLRHAKNRGKGAAIRTALEAATGDVCIVHDADMEYNPNDFPALLTPFIEEGADAVFGSRYLAAPYRRALMHRHTVMNKGITSVANWLTDLNLSDIETCYKAVQTHLLKSIPLRSSDFRIEVELAFKLAKRRARIFEVPIRYSPRSYEEGKKIRARDGLLALVAMLKYALVDDLYRDDEYGSSILSDLQDARRFNKWLADTLRPFVGDRVLELGAGIGTLTGQFIPRELYVASDINPHYLHYLGAYAVGKPYLRVAKVDAGDARDFSEFDEVFDTVMMINVLEHVPDEKATLDNVCRALQPGGRAVILVPQGPRLYNSLDVVLEHRERYTARGLRASLERAGLRIERLFDFNRTSVPAWFMSGNVLKRTRFSRVQLKVLETLMPLIRRVDHMLPWNGLSVVAVAVKPEAATGNR